MNAFFFLFTFSLSFSFRVFFSFSISWKLKRKRRMEDSGAGGGDEEVGKMERFLSWLSIQGLPTNKLEPAQFGDAGLGLIATEDIAVRNKVAQISALMAINRQVRC